MLSDNRHVLLVALAVLALLGLVAVVRGTRRQVHEAQRALHSGAAAMSLAGRSVFTGAAIVGVQWAVVTYSDPRSAVFWVALGVPALLASYTLTRAFTVSTTVVHRGGGRR